MFHHNINYDFRFLGANAANDILSVMSGGNATPRFHFVANDDLRIFSRHGDDDPFFEDLYQVNDLSLHLIVLLFNFILEKENLANSAFCCFS